MWLSHKDDTARPGSRSFDILQLLHIKSDYQESIMQQRPHGESKEVELERSVKMLQLPTWLLESTQNQPGGL